MAKLVLDYAQLRLHAVNAMDLLHAETALKESRINLLKARTEHIINVVRLNMSPGTIIW